MRGRYLRLCIESPFFAATLDISSFVIFFVVKIKKVLQANPITSVTRMVETMGQNTFSKSGSLICSKRLQEKVVLVE